MINFKSKFISEKRLEDAVNKTGHTRLAFIEMPYTMVEDLTARVKSMAHDGIVKHVAIRQNAPVVWIDCDIFFRAFGNKAVLQNVSIQEEEYGDSVVRFVCDFDGVRYVTYVRKEEVGDE